MKICLQKNTLNIFVRRRKYFSSVYQRVHEYGKETTVNGCSASLAVFSLVSYYCCACFRVSTVARIFSVHNTTKQSESPLLIRQYVAQKP